MSKRRKKKLPQDPTTATTTRLSHDGRGITQIEGKTTFLFGALAHETVQFQYTQMRGQFDEGTTTAVLDASPDRVTPKCPHFGVCGGCSLQHMDPAAQRTFKEAALLDLLAHQAKIIPHAVLPPITSPPWGYRRKARIGLKCVPKKEKVIVGFRERNGRFITDATRCEVLHPSVGEALEALSACLFQLTTRAHLPQIEVAVDDTQTAIILRHLVPLPPEDLAQLEAFCEAHAWRLYLQPGGADSISLHSPQGVDPALSYRLPQYDLTLAFMPQQFTQINATVNLQMIDQAITLLDLNENDRVLDLFCGIGNFSLPLAQRAAHVVGVEGDESAVAQATHNAQINGLTQATFHYADLFETPYNGDWAAQRYDKILLDPPRAGAQAVVSHIAQWDPKRIVYVSCNPATLARDAAILHAKQYQLSAVGILDMFPHTQHVEAMALFEKT